MDNIKISTDRMRLASVKYYDTAHNGAEVSSFDAYAFLYLLNDGKYINLFDPYEDLPVLERTFYSNVTSSGCEYGTKLLHVYGELVDGPCYVVEKTEVEKFFKKDEVLLSDVRDYILASDDFFVDRLNIIKKMDGSIFKKKRFLSRYLSDEKDMSQLKTYLNDHDKCKKYVK